MRTKLLGAIGFLRKVKLRVEIRAARNLQTFEIDNMQDHAHEREGCECLVHESNNWVKFWRLIISTSCWFSALNAPYVVAFGEDGDIIHQRLILAVDVVWILEIISNFAIIPESLEWHSASDVAYEYLRG